MAKQTFTTGQVLTAAQMTSLQQTAMGGGSTTAKVASYVLVAADAGTVVQMNSASATTITVNTALFAAGDTVQIQNVGAGVCTVTAGTATVSTSATLALKQYDAGSLYFNSTSASIFFAVDAADGMANVLTTTGDIIYSSSGTTPNRLGIGTSAQVLTVASGIPSWATPAASTPVAKGVSVFGSSGSQSITNNTITALTWDSETFDTDAFHSSPNTSRFTIPAGLAGKYSIKMQILFNTHATGFRNVRLYKNGASLKEGCEVIGSSTAYVGSYINADLDLIVGDYIEFFVYQNSGGAMNVYTTVLDSTYSMMYWGS